MTFGMLVVATADEDAGWPHWVEEGTSPFSNIGPQALLSEKLTQRVGEVLSLARKGGGMGDKDLVATGVWLGT